MRTGDIRATAVLLLPQLLLQRSRANAETVMSRSRLRDQPVAAIRARTAE